MENVIKEIKFKIDKKEFTLTTGQARKFKEALDELFGKEVIKEIREEHHHHDYSWPYRWYWRNPSSQEPYYQIGTSMTYCSNTNTATLSLTG